IGIAEMPVDESAVRLTRFRMRCVAILPKGHKPGTRATLSPKLLSGHPVAEAEYFATVCGLVASGAGWSIVDPLSAETFRHLGLTVRTFEPAIHYEIG